MRKLIVFSMMVAALCLTAFAAEKGEEAVAGVAGLALETANPVNEYGLAKDRYYQLYDRVDAGTALASEVIEIRDLCSVWGFELPEALRPGEPEDNRLDAGSGDCTSPTVIPGCPWDDTGNFDADNDCSTPSAAPYNEVFYTFTPTATGFYQFRLRNTQGTVSGHNGCIRILSGACCIGGTNVAYSSSSVAGDCEGPVNQLTYLRASLTQGVQYWIHVGTPSATYQTLTHAYEFNVRCIPCPRLESATAHATCTDAEIIACPDSVLGTGSSATVQDWYKFTTTGWDSVYIFVGGREFGHCNSGVYPGATAIDGRYTLYNITNGCPGDSIGYSDDEGCSYDALKGFRLPAGTYAIKVWNVNTQDYVLKTRCFPTEPPIDCNTYYPCGQPAEVEPNNLCTDANILSVAACGQSVYGTVCPTADLDLWYVPATTPGQIVTVRIYDGLDCMTYPPTSAALRIATSSTYTCLVPTGTSYYAGFIFGGCVPWPGGWLAVSRFAGAETKYRLETICTMYECPCPAPTEPLTAQHCQTCAGPIVDLTTVVYTINVPIEYRITDLNVCVDVTHTWDGDVTMTLVTPWLDSLTLVNQRGSSGDNFRVTTFDDEAATSIVAGTPPYNGSFQPEAALTAVDGNNAIGNWQLVIYDGYAGDVGYVHCWCLQFTYDIILAVELASFDAIAGDGEIMLRWATASESNNDRFEILRNGARAATMRGAGSSSNRTEYSWTDSGLENGVTYTYELIAVDLNNSRTSLGSVNATPSENAATISEYALYQNYPNPFNPGTQITFDLPENGLVTLKVYNLVGQEVVTLVSGSLSAGRHIVSFDARDLPSGLYMYKLTAGEFTATKKMLLMK
ncbi:T9SS type A sorting domain-containing protein [bacterium]|nr:T9SS type A sorting domain-containing protein [bacterium]MBU1984788.1 T9SS type A sorting domain-containing protein [bacterium]